MGIRSALFFRLSVSPQLQTTFTPRYPPELHLHYGDVTDSSCLNAIIAKLRPDEIYNLAAQSHVAVSFEMSEYTAEVDAVGTLRMLNAIRTCGLEKTCRFYQASTSELYGKVQEVPQSETTPFYPRSPYGKRPWDGLLFLRMHFHRCSAADPALLTLPCSRGQAVRVLDARELPRGVRHAREQRHPL